MTSFLLVAEHPNIIVIETGIMASLAYQCQKDGDATWCHHWKLILDGATKSSRSYLMVVTVNYTSQMAILMKMRICKQYVARLGVCCKFSVITSFDFNNNFILKCFVKRKNYDFIDQQTTTPRVTPTVGPGRKVFLCIETLVISFYI